jgi:carboxyl-terminal processing protease
MRGYLRLILCCFFFVEQAFAAQAELKTSDIHKIMEKFFSYHVEAKAMSGPIARRALKIYVEQFDPEKVYLLDSEVSPYLKLSDEESLQVAKRMASEDYSDFDELNALFQRSIFRARSYRSSFAAAVREGKLDQSAGSSGHAAFAKSEKALAERQWNRLTRFYAMQKSRANLSKTNRKLAMVELFEKRVRKMESNYLFVQPDGEPIGEAKAEHFMAVKILKSFAKSLDTHTAFFSPEEAQEMRLSLEKQFEGVGVVLAEGVDGVLISEVVKGSPAERSGQIRPNDIVLSINGKVTAQMSFDQVLDTLKHSGHDIELVFRRTDLTVDNPGPGQTFRVKLKKQPIVMDDDRMTTSFEKVDGGVIGKISLYSFYENSDGISSERDIREAIKAFRKEGELKGLVLDLRHNSGGYLSQAVKVAGLFISNGIVVVSKYGKNDLHYLRSIAGKSTYNGPLVVLTSKMSASASEIVAQALQDYGVALVVGDVRTFGKGSIQYQTVSDEKADLFFKVTVGRYYTVSGKSTQIEGVKADIVVPSAYAPYNIGERFLEYPLTPDSVEPVYVDPLTDLDEKTRYLFQAKYLPFIQRAISFWKNRVVELKERSRERLASHKEFQEFLRLQEKIKPRVATLPVNTIEEMVQTSRDLQMEESIFILQDMIEMEAVQPLAS